MPIFHQDIGLWYILGGKLGLAVFFIVCEGLGEFAGEGKGGTIATKRGESRVIGLVLGIACLRNDFHTRIVLSKVRHTSHMIDMTLGQDQVTERIRRVRVEIVSNDRRLNAHTGIDLDISLGSLQQVAV